MYVRTRASTRINKEKDTPKKHPVFTRPCPQRTEKLVRILVGQSEERKTGVRAREIQRAPFHLCRSRCPTPQTFFFLKGKRLIGIGPLLRLRLATNAPQFGMMHFGTGNCRCTAPFRRHLVSCRATCSAKLVHLWPRSHIPLLKMMPSGF